MIGPNEKADEPFGTIGYVAPEILRKEPYSSSCDIYSYGCTLWALLMGALPFDSDRDIETRRMTIEEPLKFESPIWRKKTPEIRDLLTKLLEKDQSKRITIKAALNHAWFKKPKDVMNSTFFNQRRGLSHVGRN